MNRLTTMTGWRRTLAVMFLAQLLSATGFSVTFPFLPLYVHALGTQTGISLEFWAGMAFSGQALTMMLVAPFWGALADRYGRKLMVERAMFGGAVLLFLMAFVRSAEELVLLRAVQGLITGTDSAANAMVASVTPRERMGFAMGMLQVGMWGGIALGPLIGGVLADAFGYSMPFFITAALLALAGILVWRGVDEAFEPAATPGGGRPTFISEWRHVVSMPGVSTTYALRFMNALSRSMITPILPLFVQSLLLTSGGVSTFTGTVVGISSVATTISAIVLGRLGDRIGHRRVVITSALAAAVFFLPQAVATSAWQFLILQILSGAATGGLLSSPSALLAQYTEPGEEGAVYGIDNSVVAAGRAAAPLISAGVAFAWGLQGAFVLTAALLAMMALLAARWLPQAVPEQQLKAV